jgi:hypothetical protein
MYVGDYEDVRLSICLLCVDAVSALSGYYQGLVFSIMLNSAGAHVDTHAEIVEGVNEVALALCDFVDAQQPPLTARI